MTQPTCVTFENLHVVEAADLVDTVRGLKSDGHRLVTYSCTELDETTLDLLYHFDKDLEMTHLRLTVPKDGTVPSLSGVYLAAFLIENEIRDQYGLVFDGLVIDYGGAMFLESEVQHSPLCRYMVTDAAKAVKADQALKAEEESAP